MPSTPYTNLPPTVPDDWTSPDGLATLKSLVTPSLPFEPRDFQLYDSACILNGQDLFCISATGDGKSALIYIPALVRPHTITVVVEPTNFLEEAMAENLRAKGLLSVVINSDTLLKATLDGWDLWQEARACNYQIIALSPESLKSPEFSIMISTPYFRASWRVLAIDEAHLTDEWGADFRPLYEDIWSIRPRGPEHLTVVALSTSVEPGGQTRRILRHLGFTEGAYHMDRRDCERRNVDFVFHDVRYPYSGHEFRDLDWLVPASADQAWNPPKRVVYCETIELGHWVSTYLRSLLPTQLQAKARILVHHLHSMNCPECKKEGLDALYATGSNRTTVVFVSTAVTDVGIDAPDIDEIVVYPSPSSASSTIQRAGRPARRTGMRGKAIIYVKKSDLDAAKAYADAMPRDSRLLSRKDSHDRGQELATGIDEIEPESTSRSLDSDIEMQGTEFHRERQATESTEKEDITEDDAMDVDEPTVLQRVCTGAESSRMRTQSRGKKNSKHAPASRSKSSKDGTKDNSSLLLIIAAHARNRCIVRQANMVFGNPVIDRDCSRCSSCIGDTVPEPRPKPPMLDSTVASSSTDKTPQWQRLTQSDRAEAATQLRAAIRHIYLTGPTLPDSILLDDTCIVTDSNMNAITHDLHLLTLKAMLEERMKSQRWRYWATLGSLLWDAVDRVRHSMSEKLEARHGERQEKRRAMAVHKDLVKNGLDGVKKVKLVLRAANAQQADAAGPSTVANSDSSNVLGRAHPTLKRSAEGTSDVQPRKMARQADPKQDIAKMGPLAAQPDPETRSASLPENVAQATTAAANGRRRSARLRAT